MPWKIYHPDELEARMVADPIMPEKLDRCLVETRAKLVLLPLDGLGYTLLLGGRDIEILVSNRRPKAEQELTFIHEGVHVYHGAHVPMVEEGETRDPLLNRCEDLIENEAKRFYGLYPKETSDLFERFLERD